MKDESSLAITTPFPVIFEKHLVLTHSKYQKEDSVFINKIRYIKLFELLKSMRSV